MAYTPPVYDSVDFDFTTRAYIAPTAHAVHFTFPPLDKHALVAGGRWITVGLGAGAAPANRRYASGGIGLVLLDGNRRYATEGASTGRLFADRRYATDSGPSQVLPSDRRYATITGVAQFAADRNYITIGVASVELPFDDRYETEGAPSQSLGRNARYATFGITYAPLLEFDHRYAVASPADSYLYSDRRYTTIIPDSAALPFDSMWGFTMILKRGVEIVYGSKITRAVEIRCDLGLDVIKRGVEIDAAMLVPIKRGVVLDAAMKTTDTILRELVLDARLINGATIIATEPPTVTVRGQTFVVDTAEVSCDEGSFVWTCQLTLADLAQYSLFGVDEPFTVTLGTEDYAFIRNEPRFSQTGQVDLSATIAGIGPAAVYADPRAVKITRTWEDATLASDVLAELFTVDFRVMDWAIPAGRLAVDGQTPMDVAQSIARATGGLIESEPDGALYIRYRWPVSVPFIEAAAPDQVYDDARDSFNADESVAAARIENKIRVMDTSGETDAILSAEIDGREEGYNTGRTSFIPGDQPAYLIFRGENVQVDRERSSAGNLATLPAGTMTVEETITFADSREASLRYPTTTLTSYVWLGNNLGVPVVIDGKKLRVPGDGVGVLKIEYETAFLARRIANVPAVLNGETEYDVLVLVEGSQQ